MSNDPFSYLQNAGNHPDTWILVYGPLGVACVIGVLLFFWIRFRKRRENEDMNAEYRKLAQETSVPSLPVEEPLAKTVDAPEDALAVEIREIGTEDRGAWLMRLRTGLTRTRESFESGFKAIFSGAAKIDDALLERIHEILYRADVGVKTADRLIEGLRKALSGKEVDWNVVRQSLAEQVKVIFSETEKPLVSVASGPMVILIVGVNGVGKTTTIGKLAARYKASGKTVMLCAADTFRAAAIEQLQVWGDRMDVPVIKQHAGADPAAVAFDGVQAAKARGVDILIVDTAGRLHNKSELMAELTKINRSIGKDLPGAPHETWIVLDATTGQNAVQQCKAFHEATALSGIVVTKLDGTAKGGVIIGIADQFKLPIRFIGVGEKAADLRDFNGADFVEGLL